MQRKRNQALEIELEYGQPLRSIRIPSSKGKLGGMACQGCFRGVKRHAV